MVAEMVRLCERTWCKYSETGIKRKSTNLKNSLIIQEENTKKNHKRVVSLYDICDKKSC